MGPLPDVNLIPVFVLAIIGVIALGVGGVALLFWLAAHLMWVP